MELEVLKWGVEHGVTGVLAVLCAAEAWVIYKMWRENHGLQAARVRDMRVFIDISDRLHSKTHKTAESMAKMLEFVQKTKRVP